MDRMTQHDAAMVEESTAAARSPAGEAACMADLVAHFRTSAEQVERDRNAVVRMAA
jgi:methyl-accepting chemotaxis protein